MASSDKHPRRSIRLPGYDYTQAGGYFITLLAYNRACIFGEIIDGEMHLNSSGEILKTEWEKLPGRFPMLEVDGMVIMPNHLHGILIIAEGNRIVRKEAFGKPIPHSIPTVVRSYKASVALRINTIRGVRDDSVWHRNYYEHVIRNESELLHIRKYILDNPSKWDMDKENPRSALA